MRPGTGQPEHKEADFLEKMTLKNGRMISLRRALPDDAQRIIDLVNQTDTESRFMTREPGEFRYTVAQERELLSQQGADRAWFLALDGEKLIGMASVDRVGTRARLRHRATLGLVIRKDYWGQGIGRRLMAQLIAWTRQQGFEQLELEVIADNLRAKGLYERLGFSQTGLIPRAFKYSDGSYGDSLLMMMWLKEQPPSS